MITMIHVIIEDDGKVSGYATVDYSSSDETETVQETSEDELSAVFEQSGVDELAGVDEPIEAAIEEPLRFRDFLILEDGEIAFDEEYVREGDEEDEP